MGDQYDDWGKDESERKGMIRGGEGQRRERSVARRTKRRGEGGGGERGGSGRGEWDEGATAGGGEERGEG